jgi:hypothetical protein
MTCRQFCRGGCRGLAIGLLLAVGDYLRRAVEHIDGFALGVVAGHVLSWCWFGMSR